MRELSFRIAAALAGRGVRARRHGRDPVGQRPDAFTCVFGISRAGAVWCPINPRNEAAENRELLDLFGCTRPDLPGVVRRLVAQIRGELPELTTLVCLDGRASTAR